MTIGSELFGNYVAGEWRQSLGGGTRTDINPADVSDVLGEVAESSAADVDAAVSAATAAFPGWRELGPIRRAEYLRRAERVIEARAEELAAVVSREQGKLLKEARGEVQRALAIIDFTAGEARRLNGETTPAEEPRTLSYTFRSPIGVVGLVTPWNFPLAIPMWKVAPALLSGCTAILKPSPLTPLTAALLTEMFAEAGVPPGVLNVVQGDREAGERLVAHPDVRGISFTGSLQVGKAIHTAGAPRLLRTQLELGGKNAVIVCADANLDKAIDAIVRGAFGQAGQRCSATSRVIVDRKVKEPLLERLAERVRALRVGRGDDPEATVCPVVNEERMTACLRTIEGAERDGAKIAVGGRRVIDGVPDGYYIEPTVLRDVPWDCEIAQEEVFGPVLSVIDADGFDEAIDISNSVRYGMSGTIFTETPSQIFEALNRFEAGMLHVNRPGVGAYAHLPHIGSKASQYGPAECSSQVWEFYTEWKSACISY